MESFVLHHANFQTPLRHVPRPPDRQGPLFFPHPVIPSELAAKSSSEAVKEVCDVDLIV